MEAVQFKLVLPILFALFLLLIPSIQGRKISYCDKKTDYAVKVNEIKITPDPIKRGKTVTFSISASTGQDISGGTLVIEVSYFGIRIHSEKHDLCSETSCPVSSGDFVISHSQVLPSLTPPGSYSLKLKMNDGNGPQLTCITFDFSIGFVSSVAEI